MTIFGAFSATVTAWARALAERREGLESGECLGAHTESDEPGEVSSEVRRHVR